METDEIVRKVDEAGEEWPQLYGLFGEKGGEAVDIFHYSDPDSYHLPMADEVYNTVMEENEAISSSINSEEFEKIVNFLSRAEVLPAWSSSSPFRILMDDVDEKELATAYEHVSGEQYFFPEEPVDEIVELPQYLKS